MAKKSKKVVKTKEQLVVDDLIVGENVKDLHGEDVEITEELIEKMEQFEQESNAHALWKNKVTGSFLFWNMPKKEKKSKEEVDEEEIEVEVGELDEELEFDEEASIFTGKKSETVYQIGQEIKIRVIAANKRKGTVDFEQIAPE